MEPIAIASDHAGRELKDEICSFLKELKLDVIDLGVNTDASVDYPDKAVEVAARVSTGEVKRGILVCGTGIGMSIAANKFPNVRAALVSDVFSARMSKEHNDANILVLGGRIVGKGLGRELVRAWLDAKFAGGRHEERIEKIKEIEKKTGI